MADMQIRHQFLHSDSVDLTIGVDLGSNGVEQLLVEGLTESR